uniref:Cytochrome P450 n=1 Tax=Solanum tuberosum TaxID=4113 RepID=M1AYX8_SOLTU
MALIIWTTIIVAIAIYIFHKLLNKKKLPPGPWGLPILGHLHLIGKNPHQDFYKLAKKYGPFMHLQLGLVPTIVVSSPKTIEKVLKTYDHVFASRPHHEASQHVCYGQRNLIFSKYGSYWRNMRKLTTMNLGITSRLKALSKVFDEFLEKIIDEHVESKEQKETKDFVDTMMDIMQSGEAGFKFDRCHVKAVLLDMLMTSMDTSATSVEWILTELLRHPHVMKKLQKELEQVVGLDRMVEESDLENLNYLDMVIKEALRLHSAAPLLIHESIQDCVVDGFFVQKGSRIIVNVYAAQRDPNAWPEPDKFLPERFVESTVDLRGHDFQLLPFSSGRRSCPGMQLGIIIVRLVVAQLVHCFDWELPNGMQPSELDMSEQFGVVNCRAKHLMAIPTYRLQL